MKLCHSSSIAQHPKYVTLSHCWGTAPFFTLLSSNLKAFQEEIPFEALSKTFLDAIEVARFTGFQYLWIDSLCIIQDDESDWAKESALMCAVYGGSSLNLAASGAVDGSVGLFHPRNDTWRCQVPLTTAKKHATSKTIECYSPRMETALQRSILSQRGWVVQERILSHRTLHFTEEQIFWECNYHICCEVLPTSVHSDTYYRFPYSRDQTTVKNWDSIILAYSTCNLTYDRDKLVAISGLAQLVHSDSKVRYVAGMWMDRFIVQLCWRVESSMSSDRYEEYIAPSWSWASIPPTRGGVSMPCYNENFEGENIAVEDLKMEYVTKSPFGAISAATLRVSCEFLWRATVSPSPEKGFIVRIAGEVFACVIWPDYEAILEEGTLDVILMSAYFNFHWHVGLMLRPVGVAGTFERIGMFRSSNEFVDGRNGEKRTLDWVMKQDKVNIEEDKCVDVIMRDGKKRFVIDLV